jgi:hypothetical protein
MNGAKAAAATQGIREMLLRCQTTGPRGADRSYFRFVLITFDEHARIYDGCNARPVREINPDGIVIRGDGGFTNIAEALELACSGISRFLDCIADHPERAEYPLPLVLLFSDGLNNQGDPLVPARRLKQLNLEGVPITIAAAGISNPDDADHDEALLREIASKDCYVHVDDVQVLSRFLAEVGSSGASAPREAAAVIDRLRTASRSVRT